MNSQEWISTLSECLRHETDLLNQKNGNLVSKSESEKLKMQLSKKTSKSSFKIYNICGDFKSVKTHISEKHGKKPFTLKSKIWSLN